MTRAEELVATWHVSHRAIPFLTDFRAMKGDGSLNAAMDAYEAGTESERKLLKSHMRTKLANHRSRPDQWNSKTRRLAKQYFRMEPDRPIQPPSTNSVRGITHNTMSSEGVR